MVLKFQFPDRTNSFDYLEATSHISVPFACAFTIMHRVLWSIDTLSSWSALNDVEMNGVAVSVLQADRGCGIVALRDTSAQDPILMTVPRELVLSLETIWEFAKSDHHLSSILNAVGEFGKVRTV